jgi:hypothetical protein
VNEKSPDPDVARVRALCANCRNLGTVEVPGKPGLHVLCAECANLHGGPKRPIYARRDEYRDPPTLPFTLPPEPVVTDAEREEVDRIFEALDGASDDMQACSESILQSVGADRAWIAGYVDGMRYWTGSNRHDDIVGSKTLSFCAGLLCGALLVGVLLWLL